MEVLTSGRRSYTPLISTAPESNKEERLTVKEQGFADCTHAGKFHRNSQSNKTKYQYVYSENPVSHTSLQFNMKVWCILA